MQDPALPWSLNTLDTYRTPLLARIWTPSTMVEVKKYHLPPTSLIPNSPQPILHYPGFIPEQERGHAEKVYARFTENGWQTQWIFRYGPSQSSHYHSTAHECMAVLTGSATIRFGVADTATDLDENTHGCGKEDGGVEVHANAGDVFVIPAGVAHKTFDPSAGSTFALMMPGDGHSIQAEDPRATISNVELSGFTMLGAYPIGSLGFFCGRRKCWWFRTGVVSCQA